MDGVGPWGEILGGLAEMVLVLARTQVVWASPGAAARLDLGGGPVEEPGGEGARGVLGLLRPEARHVFGDALEAARLGGHPQLVAGVRGRRGDWIPCRLALAPLPDGPFGSGAVVCLVNPCGTGAVGREGPPGCIGLTRRQLEHLVEASVDPISLTRGRVVEWFSPAVERLLGYHPDDLVGVRMADLVHPDDQPQLDERRLAVAAGRPVELRCRLRHADGSWRWVELRSQPLRDAEGELSGEVVANWRGIDAEVAATHALEASETANRMLVGRLEEFIASLAHELRNPVAALRGAVDLLGDPSVEPGVLERIHRVADRQLLHLTRLLDDLLDLSRVASGELALEVRLVDLRSVVVDARDMVEGLAAERHQRVSLALPAVPVVVAGDRDRLTQAVVNLLRNSITYSDPGGSVEVGLAEVGAEARLVVSDEGHGIEAAELPAVFDRFRRAPGAAAAHPGGQGIGLDLVRRILERHRGSVEAASPGPARGSTFTVTLPLAVTVPVAVGERTAGPMDGGVEDEVEPAAVLGVPRRVLVVEDDDDVAETLSEMLALLGHHPSRASNGDEALEMFGREHPEVVLLDIGLPDRSGHEVARAIRRHPDGASTTIIALTGWGGAQDRERSRAAGIDLHLVKPLTMVELSRLAVDPISPAGPPSAPAGAAAEP